MAMQFARQLAPKVVPQLAPTTSAVASRIRFPTRSVATSARRPLRSPAPGGGASRPLTSAPPLRDVSPFRPPPTSLLPSASNPAPLLRQPARPFSTSSGGGGPAGPRLSEHPDYVGTPRSTSEAYPAHTFLGIELPTLLGRKVPENADEIAEDDPGRFSGEADRVDTRSPAEMMKAGGFFPRGTDRNITEHQAGGPENAAKSGLVSSSRVLGEATGANVDLEGEPLIGGNEGVASTHSEPNYHYNVQLQAHNSFDAGRFARPGLMQVNPYSQGEIVSTQIPLTSVTSVTGPGGRTTPYPFTPRSDLNVDDL